MSPISPGPEKPQRQFAYEAENPREFGQMPLRADNSTGSRTELNSKQSHTRVRFQDNSQEEPKISTAKRNGPSELPPLPATLPPNNTSPTPPVAGTARLDMLLGNGHSRSRAETPPKQLAAESAAPPRREPPATPTKRVSFLPEESSRARVSFQEEGAAVEETSTRGRVSFREVEEEQEEEMEGRDDRLEVMQQEEEEEEEEGRNKRERSQDPNEFISEAENLLNQAQVGVGRLEISSSLTTTHTPSVIGSQEIYRDPRQRRLQQEQDKKLSATRPPDGSKLSFQEKMKLFAAEVGENTPKEKAKISKAQREIEDEKREKEKEEKRND